MTRSARSNPSSARSETTFQAMLDAAPDAMIGVDRAGRIALVNVQTETLFGYPRDELLGRQLEMLVPDQAKALHRGQREHYFTEPRTRPLHAGLELAGRRADGTEFPAEISLSSVATDDGLIAIAAVRDISDRLLVEARSQAMLDAAPDAMIGVGPEGLIRMANTQAEAMFGAPKSELIGRGVETLIPERAKSIHPRHRESYFRDPRTRPMGVGLELAAQRSDGTEFPVEISLSSIQTRDGQLALAAIRDITDRKHAEEDLRKAREEADRAAAELLETNGELEAFNYAVAHDLRAPLRAVDGFSQALMEDQIGALGPEGVDYLGRIRRNVQRMGEMIDALLELSRLVRVTFDPVEVDLSAIATEEAQVLRQADPAREVEFVVAPGVMAWADPRLVRVLIDNLLGNAWKFTAPHARARIEFGVEHGGGAPTFFVRDDGVGFDDRFVDKLFNPFQRLHRSDEFAGSGIGLATVERIVRRHGGTIVAQGKVDEGATFRFTLGGSR
jgi:PAS domain S-box-containing protein